MNVPEEHEKQPVNDDALTRRLRRNMFFVIAIALVVAARWSGQRMVLGVALGSALSVLNIRWLTGSVRGILGDALMMPNGQVPPFTAGKLILRYYIVAFTIGAAVWTGDFHALGIGIGFAAYVGGVMIEAAYRLFLILLGRELSEESASAETIKE